MAKKRAARTVRARVDRAVSRAEGGAGIKLNVPLPKDGAGSEKFWADEIEDSETRIKSEITDWRQNIDRYEGKRPALAGIPDSDVINVNVQFYHAEQKAPNLLFQLPDVQVTGRRDETKASAPLVKAILNDILGDDMIDAAELLDEVLLDVLVSAGIGPTKVGYEETSIQVRVPTGRMVDVIDPITQQPKFKTDETGAPIVDGSGLPVYEQTLALGDDGNPEMDPPIKKILSYRYYWDRIPVDDFRAPVGFLSSRHDRAPWLGYRFYATPEELEAKYGIDTATLGDVDWNTTLVPTRDQEALRNRKIAAGHELWYFASVFDPSERNPDRVRRLVILDGAKGAAKNKVVVVHDNSPWQRFDNNGKMTGGVRGLPIQVFTLRKAPGHAYPKSDCAVLKDVADEKSMGRSQMVQQRKRNVPMRGINTRSGALSQETVGQIERGEIQSLIKFNGPINEQDLKVLEQAHYPQENMAFDRLTQQDIDRLGASGANQQGIANGEGTPATEDALIQRAVDTRQAKERTRLMRTYVRGVKQLFSLVQLFAEDEQIIELEGASGDQEFKTWNRDTIQGVYGFKINPDSALRLDAEQNRALILRLTNLVTNNPNFDQQAIARLVCETFGQDANKLVRPPAPPAPEKPKVSFAFRGEDFNPFSPQYAGVKLYLASQGIQLPEAPPVAPRLASDDARRPIVEHPHLVRAPRGVPPVDQHDADLTGHLAGPGPV